MSLPDGPSETALQIGSNVFNGMVQSFIETGIVNVGDVLGNVALGTLQGPIGTSITDGIMDSIGGIAKSRVGQKFIKGTVGTIVDTSIDWIFSGLTGREFNLGQSLTQNATTNYLSAFISDPVDAVTGSYYLHTTDFILASIPKALSLERTYRSTSRDVSCLGRGWTFPYGSRIYRDTKQEGRIHMQTVTGHALWFEKQDGRWVNQAKGTGRYSLEVSDEERLFRLTDVVEHTVCQYDAEGRLMWVEYPNRQRLTFDYDEGGLFRITTPLGNYLEVVSKDGKILQITDEIGRRNQYRYEGDFLTDVVHIDEGITHYEYDEQGHITSVTDQNGSRFVENEYDKQGRVARQNFSSGVYQTFIYDDTHRRNTIYFSETGKKEAYEYNTQLLKERVTYDDGTCETFAYSEDNLKVRETSRMGLQTAWGYDAIGRTVRERFPDGYEVCHTYDENHDLVRTWDSDGRETQNVYDREHNLILVREKISDEQWRETAKEYDAKGRCTSERDALGNITRKGYESNESTLKKIVVVKY